MAFDTAYADRQAPTRAEVDQTQGPLVLEFGTDWWGYCHAIQPQLAALLDSYPQVQHIKVEDGKGRPLGRSFRVKLWPSLVFMRDGHVVKQVARPEGEEIRGGLEAIAGAAE